MGRIGIAALVPQHLDPEALERKRRIEQREGQALGEDPGDSRCQGDDQDSSIGAQHERGTGPIAGLHLTEQLLGAIPTARISSLRAGYFLENLGASLGAVKAGGALPTFFPAKLSFPMVSTVDIGGLATELLLDPPASSRIVELGTERSHADIAAALGTVLGRGVELDEAPLEAMVPTLVGFGFPPALAALYAEMTAAVGSGLVAFESPRRVAGRESLEASLGRLLDPAS